MGSVAEEVVRKAKCPVVTVKGTAAVAEPAAA
jgi:nucleotide-binding universal stress UspA family protein